MGGLFHIRRPELTWSFPVNCKARNHLGRQWLFHNCHFPYTSLQVLIFHIVDRSLRGKTALFSHLNSCIFLLCFYISFLLSIAVTTNPIACPIVSSVVHYFGLVSVIWTTIEAVNIYNTFAMIHKFTTQWFLIVSCILSYGNCPIATYKKRFSYIDLRGEQSRSCLKVLHFVR